MTPAQQEYGYEALSVPAPLAGRICDLLGITEAMLTALRARAQRDDPAAVASIEQLAALLTGGQDAAALIARTDAAHRDLAALVTAVASGPEPGP